jgi:hypothetical protein
MQIMINTIPIQEEYITLEKGKRSRIHPNLTVLEYYNCNMVYNVFNKFFIVDYKFENGKYSKTLISSQIDYLIEVLQNA